MKQATWYQEPALTAAIAATNALTTFDVLASAGASTRYRVFAFDITINPAAAAGTVIRGDLWDSAGIGYGKWAISLEQPSDHLYFGEGGIIFSLGAKIQLRALASVVAVNIYAAVRYVVES